MNESNPSGKVDREIFAALKDKNVAIFTHINADVDAIVSAYFVKRLVENYGGKAYIIVPDGLDEVAEKVVKKYSIPLEGFSVAKKCDEFIVVDTTSLEYIGKAAELLKNKKAFIVIDHHSDGIDKKVPALHYAVSPEFSSNSEHVIERFNIKLNEKRDRDLALLAALSDYYGANMSLPESGVFDISLIKLILKKTTSQDRKKIHDAIRNTSYYNNNNILLAISYLDSKNIFPTMVSKRLLNGKKEPVLAMVITPLNGHSIRISLRTNVELPLNVISSKMEEKLSKKLGVDISSGGHNDAAGLSFPFDIKKFGKKRFFNLLADISLEIINGLFPEVKEFKKKARKPFVISREVKEAAEKGK